MKRARAARGNAPAEENHHGRIRIPLAEFDREMVSTRRLMERVPGQRAEWRPHEKSFPLGHLAQLVAGMPGWFPLILDQSELDLAGGSGYSFEPSSVLLAQFDAGVEKARDALARVTGFVIVGVPLDLALAPFPFCRTRIVVESCISRPNGAPVRKCFTTGTSPAPTGPGPPR